MGPALVISSYNGFHHTGGGFNFLVGLEHREGFFAEVKVGAGGSPDVKFGVGYLAQSNRCDRGPERAPSMNSVLSATCLASQSRIYSDSITRFHARHRNGERQLSCVAASALRLRSSAVKVRTTSFAGTTCFHAGMNPQANEGVTEERGTVGVSQAEDVPGYGDERSRYRTASGSPTRVARWLICASRKAAHRAARSSPSVWRNTS